MENKKNVYQRIQEVMNEIETIKKRGFNDFHKYQYATEADYVHALRPLFKIHGLVVIPQMDGPPTLSEPDGKGNILTTITMKFWIVNVDDPTQQVCAIVPGQGQDKGDKGAYKAMTGAKKYFAALTFMVATGDDPETESPERQPSQKKPSKPKVSVSNDEF